ncbi:MAG TPA: glutathione peroxidase [Terracidiphilus sp.]|jgi:glutathione peroxidase
MGQQKAMVEQSRSIYGFSAIRLNGQAISLAEFRGQVLLIVNTASRCGFTPQYAGLEALYRQYRERGLQVLGFPSNQFGRQEPGTAEEIAHFCSTQYGVSFPMFARIDVNGRDTHPLYGFLKRERPGTLGLFTRGRVTWNFTKFLVRRSGEVAARYAPSMRPEKLVPAIERLLDEH